MTTPDERIKPAPEPPAVRAIDWQEVALAALRFALVGGALGGALYFIAHADEDDRADEPTADPSLPDRAAVDAAALLDVPLDASAPQIRAALRSKLSASRAHPDHGGDDEETRRLIAARDLLLHRRTILDARGGA